MTLAETLNDAQRRKIRWTACASTWFGCFTCTMLENSAIIIIYLTMLKASPTLIMISTASAGFISMFFMMPSAYITDMIGLKRSVALSCCIAMGSFLLMALAPLAGAAAKYVVVAGCILYWTSDPLWCAAWYPILTEILLPEERGSFFGFMRFSYTAVTGVSFFFVGLAMGKNPPLWLISLVVGLAGILMMGRYFFISRIPLPERSVKLRGFREALGISLRNNALVGFTLYATFLACTLAALVPLILLFLKNYYHCQDSHLQIISTVSLAGSITSFFFFGKILRKVGIRNLQLLLHLTVILIPTVLILGSFFRFPPEIFLAVMLFLTSFNWSCFQCAFSTESLALAMPGNTTMALAFANTGLMIGKGAGRLVVSGLLGAGMLAGKWMAYGTEFSIYHTIFIFAAGFSVFCILLILLLPSLIPVHEEYYHHS